MTSWLVAARVSVLTGVMVLLVQFVAGGYVFGSGEQVLLSLKGISWADPDALRNDWFNDHAPQPHVLFDVVTFVGTSTGSLHWLYFVFWLASFAVAGWALVQLSDRWLPRRVRALEVFAAALMVTGPFFAFGTFLLVAKEAIPNSTGGALMFAAAAALVVGRERAAVWLSVATAVVHVQHGAVVAVLLAVAWLFTSDRKSRPWVRWYPAFVVGILAYVYVVSWARGLVGGSADIGEVCRDASPGHCAPETWPRSVIVGGLIVLAIGVLAPVLARRATGWRGVAVVAVPALIAVVALVTDLAGIEPFRTLGRSLFLYRFVMVTAAFGVMVPVLLVAKALRARPGAVATSLLAVPVVLVWNGGLSSTDLTVPYTNMGLFGRSAAKMAVIGAAATVVVIAATAVTGWLQRRAEGSSGDRPQEAGGDGQPGARLTRAGSRLAAAPLFVAVVLAVSMFAWYGQRVTSGPVPLTVGFRPEISGSVTVGAMVEQAVPPGGVLLADPSVNWLRRTSSRAVVIDCKGVPYGGEPWREYRERLASLDVPVPRDCGPEHFAGLSPDQLVEVGRRYGAEYVLLSPTSASYEYADANWPRLAGNAGGDSVFRLPVTLGSGAR